MSMRKLIKKIYSEQRGSVSMITALFMAVLIGIAGFTLDKGVYYSEGSKLQNSLDKSSGRLGCVPASRRNTRHFKSNTEAEKETWASRQGKQSSPFRKSVVKRPRNCGILNGAYYGFA